MFESGKKTTNKKPDNNAGKGLNLPTIEEMLGIFYTHYEILFTSSNNHDAVKLAEFERDKIAYIKKTVL